MDKSLDRILSASEAAHRLHLSVRTPGRIAASNAGLKKIQLSTRRVGYRESDISTFIERGGFS